MYPHELAVDDSGVVYVCYHRIQIFLPRARMRSEG